MKRKYKIIGLLIMVLISLVCFLYYQNNALSISEYQIESDEIPKRFDDYTIVQLSDLHNKWFGEKQNRLTKKVKTVEPDVIVFTGDLVDKRKYKEEPSLVLMDELVQIAPVYYVTGNHEWSSEKFDSLEGKLKDSGVNVLRNTSDEIHIGSDSISIIGIDDPTMMENEYIEGNATSENMEAATQGIDSQGDFQVLLAHRPEKFPIYAEYEMDLIFSGHAHGGQFRIPFIGRLVAPGQGFFPAFTSGKHRDGNSTMIVNRGLGNSIIPQRLFNRPEIVVVKLSGIE